MVHHASRAQVATAILLACGLAACGGGDSQAPVAGLGAPVRTANCGDWNKGSPRARRQTIEQVRAFAGGPVAGGGHGNTLTDDEAYELFDKLCDPYYARGFKLYKLYTRSAAFSPQR